jgi:hypothetical protein
MARRTARSTRAAELAFDAVTIEGGLLAADWLARAAQLEAPHQDPADYAVPKGLELRDEIGRYWRIAQAQWAEFEAGQRAKAEPNALARRFVVSLLRDAFGFSDLVERPPACPDSLLDDQAGDDHQQPVELAGRAWPLTAIDAAGRVPLVCAPAAAGLDSPHPHLGDEYRKRSAFGLVQEFLNASDDALWGLCSDGLTLRLARDNASLTRPAWIEVDLARIFTEELYPDFAAAWLVLHRSRFGRAEQAPETCTLETWRAAAQEEGTRARNQLRAGVEAALVVLGQGFVSHSANGALRAKLHDGTIPIDGFFGELLRLVYRLIFLLTVEERHLLHVPTTPVEVRERYAQGYSIRRLRDRSARRAAYDRHDDLWDATQIVFRCLATGEAPLGLPALGGLFEMGQCPNLDGAKLQNRALLEAMFRLCWLRTSNGIARVNWRDMGPEELGSVYESLLELVPRIADEGRTFGFAKAEQGRATARKESGSYYTPDSLVQALLDVSLEPLIRNVLAKNPENPDGALLGITLVDPACGSGHFLLAAARRIATHLARARAQGTPSASEYREALRAVVGTCVYGVDLNPMAVELCRVALWMEAIVPGRPLSFLEAHIRHGNALIGATPELLEAGLPDHAWEAVEGDDKKTASRLKKANKGWRQGNLFDTVTPTTPTQLAELSAAVETAEDDSLEALHAKSKAWHDYEEHPAVQHATLLADLWCSAFFWPKVPGNAEGSAPVRGLWEQVKAKPESLPSATKATMIDLKTRYHFFHWSIAFPQVFARGGFDLVLGNPPWDTLSPDAKEFFARWEPQIREQTRDEQASTIEALVANPQIAEEWQAYRRRLFTWVHFLKRSRRFTLYARGNLGKGDFNIYRMFVEAALTMARNGGYAAQVVPDGLYSGANTAAIRQTMLEGHALDPLLGFENAAGVWFPGVHRSQKLCLYAARRTAEAVPSIRARFGIRTHADLTAALRGELLRIPVDLIREFSPDALAIMEFGDQRDIDIASKMYARWPKFGDESAGPPHRQYMREIDMGNDRDLFSEKADGLPLYEGRMVSHYDHRAKGYRSGRGRAAVWEDLPFSDPGKSIQPQWYIPWSNVPEKARERLERFRIGFCDVTGAGNERTFMSALLPAGVLAGHSLPTVTFEAKWEWAYVPWLAVANSMAMDFVARFKASNHMTFGIIDSLPFPRLPLDHPAVAALAPRVLRLTCTGPEMTPFWNAMAEHGWVEPVEPNEAVPGLLDEEERLVVAAELEVIVARDLYGLNASEMEHVLATFPIVERRQVERYGEYRTKRLVLEGFNTVPRVDGGG